ncbi:hypothetical protein [Terrihabitans rhizophilus]|uniref:Uncharacterized protein n=1 Tax=Terrihabitans rhizophilus TaxID=3092662 RepID=A0ABU4RQ32_9HYPH|nr:hypothetical protein [Terrihabitans sp. PJ23]MDX6806939.1 hypothetical protein [Terrihabitans sp. PJ23]
MLVGDEGAINLNQNISERLALTKDLIARHLTFADNRHNSRRANIDRSVSLDCEAHLAIEHHQQTHTIADGRCDLGWLAVERVAGSDENAATKMR